MSLRNIQQIDKLLVGEIQPRTNRNEYLSAGLILLTDNTGKANWTTISTLSRTYAQFTTISTASGIINAANSETGINLVETDGIGIQVVNESLVFKNTGLLAFDISGSNMILGSNSSNGVVNNVVKFAGGKNTRLRADPGTNTLYFDTDLIVSSMGPRFSFTDIGLYQSRSNIEQNDSFESFIATNSSIEIFHANKAESLLNIVGTGDLTVRGSNINNTVSIFLGLSTYNAKQFLETTNIVKEEFPRIKRIVEQLNFRQTVTTGVVLFGDFNPVSSLTSLTARNLSSLSNTLVSTLNREHQQIFSFSTFNLSSSNANLGNVNSITSYIGTLSTQNGFITTLSTAQITTSSLITNNVGALRGDISSIFSSNTTTKNLTAETGNLSNITVSNSLTGYEANLNLVNANILTISNTLQVPNITASSLTISNSLATPYLSNSLAHINSLSVNTISSANANISSVNARTITASSINVIILSASMGYLSTAIIGNLTASNLSITGITENDTALIKGLSANTISSGNASISSISAKTITATTISTSALNVTTLSSSVGLLSSVIARTVSADRFIGNGAAITNLTLPTMYSTVFFSTSLLEASSITSYDFKGVGSVNLLSTLRVSDFSQFNENVSMSKRLNLSSLALTGNALISSANVDQISTGTITAQRYQFATGEDFTIKYNISTIVLNLANSAYTPTAPNRFYCFSNTANTGTIYQVFVGEPSLSWQNGDWIGLLINQYPENNNSYRFTSYFSTGSYWLDSIPLIGGKAVKLIYSAGSWSCLC